MKSIRYENYGSPDVLDMVDVSKPSPNDNEVLIKVRASSVTRADTMMRKGAPYIGRLMLGICKPKFSGMGTGFAGDVEAVGKNVTAFCVGDKVFGESVFGTGANAEYVCVSENAVLMHKPENISYDQACGVCDGALTSINFLQNVGKVKTGDKILIIGASGSLGSAALQLAKHMGAHVTAVCSLKNSAWVSSLGADNTISYDIENILESECHYDIIYDTTGHYSYSRCKKLLTQRGIYLSPVFSIKNVWHMFVSSFTSGKKARFSATGMRPLNELRELLEQLLPLLKAGKLQPYVDKQYSLNEIVDAHRYVEKGHKRGNVVLN